MDEILKDAFSDLLNSSSVQRKERSELIDIAFDALFSKGNLRDIRASSVTGYVDRFLGKLVRTKTIRRVRQGTYAFGPAELLDEMAREGQVVTIADVSRVRIVDSEATRILMSGNDFGAPTDELERVREENENLSRQIAEFSAVLALPSTLLEWIEHERFLCVGQEELAHLLALQGTSL